MWPMNCIEDVIKNLQEFNDNIPFDIIEDWTVITPVYSNEVSILTLGTWFHRLESDIIFDIDVDDTAERICERFKKLETGVLIIDASSSRDNVIHGGYNVSTGDITAIPLMHCISCNDTTVGIKSERISNDTLRGLIGNFVKCADAAIRMLINVAKKDELIVKKEESDNEEV